MNRKSNKPAARLAASLRLMLVTDRHAVPGGDLLRVVEMALSGGVTAVMLREKDLPGRDLLDLALPLREMTRRADALLIVNDRADVALAAKADGVHLGWQSMPIERVRRILGPRRVIGVSTHSVDEALRAERAGADYATFGPVFPTPSKRGLVEVQGLEGVRAVRATGLKIALVGLGGIDAGNAATVFDAGADGVAAIRALLGVEDPARVAREILAQAQSRHPTSSI